MRAAIRLAHFAPKNKYVRGTTIPTEWEFVVPIGELLGYGRRA
jgi:hypothetical protein